MADAVLQHGSGPDGGVDHARLLPVFLESLPTSVASMVTTYHSTLCLKYTERHLRSIDHVRSDCMAGKAEGCCVSHSVPLSAGWMVGLKPSRSWHARHTGF